jgi:hypothetical protein
MAEGEGFEPPARFPVQWFSRPWNARKGFRQIPVTVTASQPYRIDRSYEGFPELRRLSLSQGQFWGQLQQSDSADASESKKFLEIWRSVWTDFRNYLLMMA